MQNARNPPHQLTALFHLRQVIASSAELSEESWNILQSCTTELSFKKNELLLKEGQVCEALYFISSGLCRAFYNRDGKEINTAFYFETAFATNIRSLKEGIRSEYAIKTCEPCQIIRLGKAELLKAYKMSHEIETFGRNMLERIIVRQEAHSNSFKLLSPKQRFDNLRSEHPDFLQRVSLTHVSSYLGISRETLSRFRSMK